MLYSYYGYGAATYFSLAVTVRMPWAINRSSHNLLETEHGGVAQ